jgi:hypothetical protein
METLWVHLSVCLRFRASSLYDASILYVVERRRGTAPVELFVVSYTYLFILLSRYPCRKGKRLRGRDTCACMRIWRVDPVGAARSEVARAYDRSHRNG